MICISSHVEISASLHNTTVTLNVLPRACAALWIFTFEIRNASSSYKTKQVRQWVNLSLQLVTRKVAVSLFPVN